MIPDTDPDTGYLPFGVHRASRVEVKLRFELNSRRAWLIGGMYMAFSNLAGAGCRNVLLDGSFISEKSYPNDYDGAWEPRGVNPDLLDPVLLDFSNGRAAMKAKFHGELFPATASAESGVSFREFFQTDRNGIPKGIVEIDLGNLP